MAPASLDRLPTEILHMILGHLGFHCGNRLSEPPDAYYRGDWQQRDQPSWYSLQLQPLLTLCLVSRRLCSAIQPLLFSEFMLGYGDSWRSHRYTWNSRLTSFMRTVARRQDLAASVKWVYIPPYLKGTFDETEDVVLFGDSFQTHTS